MTKTERKTKPESFAVTFPKSQMFDVLFKSGMSLVQEVAAYQSGPGKRDVKQLTGDVALMYEKKGVQMTLLLMQVASWLLLMRALKEEEISLQQFFHCRRTIKEIEPASSDAATVALPAEFRTLLTRTDNIVRKINRLDGVLENSRRVTAPDVPGRKDARSLQAMLAQAFCSS